MTQTRRVRHCHPPMSGTDTPAAYSIPSKTIPAEPPVTTTVSPLPCPAMILFSARGCHWHERDHAAVVPPDGMAADFHPAGLDPRLLLRAPLHAERSAR